MPDPTPSPLGLDGEEEGRRLRERYHADIAARRNANSAQSAYSGWLWNNADALLDRAVEARRYEEALRLIADGPHYPKHNGCKPPHLCTICVARAALHVQGEPE